MGFVQTAFLGAAAAVAIPIAVHLIHRWQTQQVELGSVRFLTKLVQEHARRKRIKRRLLLAMRIAGDKVRPEETLVSLPITLRGGAQSVTPKIRSDDQGREFEVRIPQQEDELSSQNNVMIDEVQIDPTKVRVLYIEGSD